MLIEETTIEQQFESVKHFKVNKDGYAHGYGLFGEHWNTPIREDHRDTIRDYRNLEGWQKKELTAGMNKIIIHGFYINMVQREEDPTFLPGMIIKIEEERWYDIGDWNALVDFYTTNNIFAIAK
jgi:hypothetical protein